VSRFDYIYIADSLLKEVTGLDSQDISDLSRLEFQTKDLDREFLEYFIDDDKRLHYEDFYYELVDSIVDGLFNKQMRKVDLGTVKSNFTGIIMFYGKPYEQMYTFHAKITNGELKYIRLLSIV
jgi:hypothetical protein